MKTQKTCPMAGLDRSFGVPAMRQSDYARVTVMLILLICVNGVNIILNRRLFSLVC